MASVSNEAAPLQYNSSILSSSLTTASSPLPIYIKSLLSSSDNVLCLDLKLGKILHLQKFCINHVSGSASQKWIFEESSGKIKNMEHHDFVIGVALTKNRLQLVKESEIDVSKVAVRWALDLETQNLVPLHNPSLCLDVKGESSKEKTPVILWTRKKPSSKDNLYNQQWQFVPCSQISPLNSLHPTASSSSLAATSTTASRRQSNRKSIHVAMGELAHMFSKGLSFASNTFSEQGKQQATATTTTTTETSSPSSLSSLRNHDLESIPGETIAVSAPAPSILVEESYTMPAEATSEPQLKEAVIPTKSVNSYDVKSLATVKELDLSHLETKIACEDLDKRLALLSLNRPNRSPPAPNKQRNSISISSTQV